MTYELPDFPIGIVYKSNTISGVIDYKKAKSKEQLATYLNTLLNDPMLPNCEITIYKKTIEYNNLLKINFIKTTRHDIQIYCPRNQNKNQSKIHHFQKSIFHTG